MAIKTGPKVMRKPLRINVLRVTVDNARLLAEWFPALGLSDALVLLNNATNKAWQDGFTDSVHIAAKQVMLLDYLRKRTSEEVVSIVSRLG